MPEKSPIENSFWNEAKPLIPELQDEVWIDKYRVDFLIPSKKIIIELYGFKYHSTKEKITKDAERERHLQKLGYQIIRFTGTEIHKDVKKCVSEVIALGKIETNNQIKFYNEGTTTHKQIKKTKPQRRKRIERNRIIILIMLGTTTLCCVCSAINQIIRNIL